MAPPPEEATAIVVLVLLVVAIVPGIIGVAVEGMLYLLSIGVLFLIADVGYFAVRSALRRGPTRRHASTHAFRQPPAGAPKPHDGHVHPAAALARASGVRSPGDRTNGERSTRRVVRGTDRHDPQVQAVYQ